MKNYFLLLPLFIVCSAFAQVTVTDLRTENRTNPSGLSEANPRFSWQLRSAVRGTMQTAYEIKVSELKTAPSLAGSSSKISGEIWSSGKVISDQSVYVPFGGKALKSGTWYGWQVRVWDNRGKASPWSTVARWQTALLNTTDFKAQWISATGEDVNASPLFRKTFSTTGRIKSATAFITAQGVYEARLNGKRIGNDVLTPGWTSYNKRLQYQQYDVTDLIKQGDNTIGAELGKGWYAGLIGFSGQRNFYGSQLALWMQVEIIFEDGRKELILTDSSWKTIYGGIRDSEIYNGERYDARLAVKNWDLSGTDDSGWKAVKIKDNPEVNLIATYNEPIRKKEIFKPVRIITTPKGEQVIDFGQNLTGLVTMKVRGKSGDRIVIHHAEVLDKKGNFYTDNLRAAKQQNEFILAGNGEEVFEPRFTFQGFRYIKVEGYPGPLTAENFQATALYSDMKASGTFTSSNPLINQLQHNIQWGQRGNFLDVPTDCPQRDERLGWTGDAQAFARTATFNFDVHNFFTKWLRDVESDQIDGSVPFVIPNVLGKNAAGSAGWADAATIIPWDMYMAYGDKKILENQYESMKAWVGFIGTRSTDDLWNTGFHFGDWLFFRPFDDNDGRSAVTDKYLIAQCFYARSVELVMKTAGVLGKQDEVKYYGDLLKRVRAAYLREYLTPGGRLISGTQTAWVLALNFDMLPDDMRAGAAQKLVDNIKSYNNHLTTGFLGTPYLCHVLSRFGHGDLAYTLLLQESYPSWLYPVKMGATTIWERWDGIKPDSSFQTPGMNSFNHYAYGAIGDWMYRVVAGLDTDESAPGYKGITVKPLTGNGLTLADATLETPYGKARSGWKKEGNVFNLTVEIPANASAIIFIPAVESAKVTESGKSLETASGLTIMESGGGFVKVKAGSGQYQFTVAGD
ncbi:MAG: family 78 glycoside hydrolase catalytic domain [Cyclobacteriaceae bacterium]